MKNHLSSSSDEDDYESLKLLCWWRSDLMFEEYVQHKHEVPNVSSLVPRVRVIREYERLALIASEGLNEFRHKLITYRSGDFWVPIGGICKEEMEIPPVVTFLLVGFSGAGKSSLVNLMYSVLGQSGILPFAQTSTGNSSKFTGMYLEEHNVLRSMKNGFCVYDSRGFSYDNADEMRNEMSQWMTEGIHHNQLCLRPGDNVLPDDEMEEESVLRSSSMFVIRQVNCAMVVANIAEIYEALKLGDLKPLESTKQLFTSPALRKCNENPILILTHGDMLTTKERLDGRLKICETLGISESSGVYDIVCLTEYGFVTEESDRITAYALCEAVYRGLLISDRSYIPKKKLQDWAVLGLSWLMFFMAGLFSFLARLCSRYGPRNKVKL